MNRYKSSQRWRNVQDGVYESPGRQYRAERRNGGWLLFTFSPDGWVARGRYLTLADCQERADWLEARDANA